MLLKGLLLLLIFTYNYSHIYSQNPIENYQLGYYFDYNKQSIDGFYDFDYEPDISLSVIVKSGYDYSPGHYYDKGGKRISGLIKFSRNERYIYFKTNESERKIKIKSKDCDAFVIGVDSFVVIKHNEIDNIVFDFKFSESDFYQFIDEVDGLKFFKYKEIYLVKKENSRLYQTVPQTRDKLIIYKFRNFTKELFGKYELLVKEIESRKYELEDFENLLNLYKYCAHSETKTKIYFSSSWDEIKTQENSHYYAIVESVTDSAIHVKYYFNNDIIICEGDLTSISPMKRINDFIWYYPNGKIRKLIKYEDNINQQTTTFYENGNKYQVSRILNESPFYDEVYDKNAQQILDSTGNGTITYFDKVNDREIISIYYYNRIIYSYFLNSNNEKVYQYCLNNTRLRQFNYLQIDLDNIIDYPESAIDSNIHGFVFVKCIIDAQGKITEISLIKGIDEECDNAILGFLTDLIEKKHWKPGKVNGKKVTQEIILPIQFKIYNYSRNNIHQNKYWMNNNFPQHNFTQPNFPPPNIPNYHYMR